MKVIGFEGNVFAGKTTIISRLSGVLSNACVIPEFAVYSGGSSNFPTFPPLDLHDAYKSTQLFIDIERRRENDLRALSLSGKYEFVLVDRTYLTCLAFDYAATFKLKFDIYSQSTEQWSNSIKICPDKWVFLDIDMETTLKRVPLRQGVCLPHFLLPEMISKQREFYQSVSYGYQPWLTVDAGKDPEMVCDSILNFISE